MNKLKGMISVSTGLTLILCLVGCLAGVLYYFLYVRPFETTDNAYIGANYTSIAAQVSGKSVGNYISNYQFVKKDQLLFEIDPEPFLIEVKKAQAQLDLMGNSVQEAAAAVEQWTATVAQRTTELKDAKINAERTFALYYRRVLTQQDFDDADARLRVAEHLLDNAKAQLQSARYHLGGMGEENEQIRIATAALEQAKLNLSYTKVYAPFDGQISNSNMFDGQFITAGAPQFALIDHSKYWVDANFKETQIYSLKVGQHVKVTVDMYPDHDFDGEVINISGASGTVFSLLPPQNATGNWVKVTQRVPVRILIKNPDPNYPLSIGTSAYVKVKVRNPINLLANLTGYAEDAQKQLPNYMQKLK